MQNAVAEYDLTDQHQNNDHHHDRKYVEIGVPTCSYRMGVPQIGYGFAVIGEYLFMIVEFVFYWAQILQMG